MNAAQMTPTLTTIIASAIQLQNAVLTITMTGESTSTVNATQTNTVASMLLASTLTSQIPSALAPQKSYAALIILGI
jgi:hypothetical protein